MDTHTLTEALRSLRPDAWNWKLALYSTRKSRDGLELEWHLCNMHGIADQVDLLRAFLLKKPVADKPVSPYSPFLSDKENIGALDCADETIAATLSDVLLNIRNGQAVPPEDFVTGAVSRPAGYAFFGEPCAPDEASAAPILIMRRGNPFLSPAAARICTAEDDTITLCNRPVLKFAAAVDFLMIAGACYLLSSAIEKDLALENRHFAIAEKRMADIAQAGIVSDYDKLERIVMTAKNARKFVDFDPNILAHIARLPIAEREVFLSDFGVTTDPSGKMDAANAEQCELIVDLLCCRSCLDPLGRLSVGSNITPRE